MATDEFGGIEIEAAASSVDEFGGVPIVENAPLTEEQWRQQYIAQAQQGPLAKTGNVLSSLINALVVSPARAATRAIAAHPFTVLNPITTPATTVEAARRTGLDLTSMISDRLGSLAETVRESPVQSLLSPSSIAVEQGIKDVIGLGKQFVPYTPGEPELDRAFRESIMAAELAKESEATPELLLALGARPEEAQAIKEIAPLLIGGPTLKSTLPPKIGSQAAIRGATAADAKAVRVALKPKNSTLGKAVEKAAENELNDVFTVNPNADTAAASALEGFSQSVSVLENQVGKQIDIYRNQVGKALDAGDQIAAKLREKAAALKRQGAPADDVAYLESRATDFEGSMTTMEDLQAGVTTANRNRTPLFQRNFAAQNPARSNVDNVLNEIIGTEGGKIINSELKAVGGAEGAALRKKWGSLNTLRAQAEERLNKVINSAPEAARSRVVEALSSPAGAAGLFALVNGWSAGLIPIAAVAVKTWARNAAKELKNSDTIIENFYKRLRKNPPEGGFVVKPPIIGTATEAAAVAAPVVNSLEAQIQALIDTYPPYLQANPRMARETALGELASGPTPVGQSGVSTTINRPPP